MGFIIGWPKFTMGQHLETEKGVWLNSVYQ